MSNNQVKCPKCDQWYCTCGVHTCLQADIFKKLEKERILQEELLKKKDIKIKLNFPQE